MAMTLRLPPELLNRAKRYADELGLSVNGLIAVALREYLDARKPELRMAPPVYDAQRVGRSLAQVVKAGPKRGRR